MANWSDLKASVDSIIKTNGSQAITGQLLQDVLNSIISNVGKDSAFAGVATPTTNPGTPDGNVFYLASEQGEYSNFNGIVLSNNECVILEWKNGAWTKKTTGFATKEELEEFDNRIRGGFELEGEYTFASTYQQKSLGFTIPKGNIIILEGDITSINGRTNSADETYQVITNGKVADRNINFIKNTTALGVVKIKSVLKGLVSLQEEVANLSEENEKKEAEQDEQLSNLFEREGQIEVVKDLFEQGYYYNNTESPYDYKVGDLLPRLEVNTNSSFAHYKLRLKEGQKCVSSGSNGLNVKTWIFIGDDGIVKAVQPTDGFVSGGIVNNEFYAPCDGYYYYSTRIETYSKSSLSYAGMKTGLIQDVEKLKSEVEGLVEHKGEIEVTQDNYETGYFYNRLEEYKVGDVVPNELVINKNDSFKCVKVHLRTGDIIESYGKTGTAIKTWIFIGDDNIVKAVQDDETFASYTKIYKKYTAPCDGWYYFSTQLGGFTGYYIKAIIDSEGLYKEVEELKKEVEQIKTETEGAIAVKIPNGISLEKSSLDASEKLSLDDFPNHNKFGDIVSLRAELTTFDAIFIGKNVNVESDYTAWLKIDNTNIYFFKGSKPSEPTLTYPHGLTLKSFLYANIEVTATGECRVSLNTLNGSFSQSISSWGTSLYGAWELISVNSTLSKCRLSAINKNFGKPFWIFGASYEGIGSSSRWPYYLEGFGVDYKNILWNGYPGRASDSCYSDFIRCLNCAKPKYVYWTMWGNGTASSLDLNIGKAYEYCKNNGIEFIILDRPNATGASDYEERKSAIDKYKAIGVRFVDGSTALSINPSDPNGWYEGYLSSDGKHPSDKGARALAYQVILDIPEIALAY